MTQSNIVAAGSFVVSAGSGASSYLHVFDTLNYYAPLIGAFISALAFSSGLYFMWKASKKTILADENKVKLEEHIKETNKQFEKIAHGISNIMTKISE